MSPCKSSEKSRLFPRSTKNSQIRHFRDQLTISKIICKKNRCRGLSEKPTDTEFFLVRVYSFSEYGDLQSKAPYSDPKWVNAQQTFTCSKSTIEALGKGVKYLQS